MVKIWVSRPPRVKFSEMMRILGCMTKVFRGDISVSLTE